jgi:hypothetical protein
VEEGAVRLLAASGLALPVALDDVALALDLHVPEDAMRFRARPLLPEKIG